jgi:hypothetical protein
MSEESPRSLGKLLGLLERLDSAGITYRLEHVRESIMIVVAIPGERWEVEVFNDSHVEIERFVSSGDIEDESLLEHLFEREAATVETSVSNS